MPRVTVGPTTGGGGQVTGEDQAYGTQAERTDRPDPQRFLAFIRRLNGPSLWTSVRMNRFLQDGTSDERPSSNTARPRTTRRRRSVKAAADRPTWASSCS